MMSAASVGRYDSQGYIVRGGVYIYTYLYCIYIGICICISYE